MFLPENCTDWTQFAVIVTGAVTTIASIVVGAWMKVSLHRIECNQAESKVVREEIREAVTK